MPAPAYGRVSPAPRRRICGRCNAVRRCLRCHDSRYLTRHACGDSAPDRKRNWMKPALFLLAVSSLVIAQAEPRLLYTKTFPGSVPAYVSIRVERNGNGEYKDAPDDDRPLKFHLSESDASALFALVEKLN